MVRLTGASWEKTELHVTNFVTKCQHKMYAYKTFANLTELRLVENSTAHEAIVSLRLSGVLLQK